MPHPLACPPPSPPMPGPAPVALLFALASAVLLASLGVSIAIVALPTLVHSFSATVSAVQWVVLAYLIAVTATIVLAGSMGDRWGHQRVLVAGLLLFGLASLLCAAAPSLGLLVAGRALQGMGGAIMMALPLSMARERLPKERLGAAMGLLGTMSALGTALGPALGGVLISGWGWRAGFVVLAALAAGALVLCLRAQSSPGPRPPAPAHGVDWAGALLLALALVLLGLATVGDNTAVLLAPGVLLALAAAALALLAWVESRASLPLLPLGLLRQPALVSSLSVNLLVATVMMAVLVVGPFFLSFSLGLNPTQTGLVMAAGPLIAALSGVLAGRLADRLGARRSQWVALVQIIAALICLAWLPRWLGVAGYVMALALLTPGFQLFLAANSTAVLLGAAASQRGVLSGLWGLSRNLGLMAGASTMPQVFSSLLGPKELALSAADDIGLAFSLTFMVAAGLCVLALALSARAPAPGVGAAA